MEPFFVSDSLVSFWVWYDGHCVGKLADFGVGDLGFFRGDSSSWFWCGGFGAVGR